MNIIMNMRRLVNLALVMCIVPVLMFSGCEVPAGGETVKALTSPSGNQPDRVIPQPRYHNTLRIWRDVGGSEDNDAFVRVVADELVAAIAKKRDSIIGVEVVRYANGDRLISEEPVEKFIWGGKPEATEFKTDIELCPSEAKFFKEAMERCFDAQKRSYDEQSAQVTKEYNVRVEEQLRRLKDYLVQRPTGVATCTSFTSLASRMKTEDLPLNLTITDGWADCPMERDGKVEGVTLHGKHAIIQLPRVKDSLSNQAELPERAAFMHTLFPAAEVFPTYMTGRAVDSLLP